MKRIIMVLAIWTSMCAYAFGQGDERQQGEHHSMHRMHRMKHRHNAHGRNWNKGYNRNNRNGEYTVRRSNNTNP